MEDSSSRMRPTLEPTQLFAGLPGRRSTLSRWLTISLTLHAAIITAFLIHHPHILRADQLPGDLNGHRMLLTYTPGQVAPSAPPPTPRPAPSPLQTPHLPQPPAPPSTAPPSTSTSNTPASTVGTDTFGDGDIKIASVLAHPHPNPDLSALPSGTRGDVVVDIVIDPDGHIAKSTLERGLGHGIDESVLATIQHWTFTPATRNGIPVASEQELLFHYERA